MFIGLTFAGFFLFEVRKRLAHPIQYGLVGAALALFYLLLFRYRSTSGSPLPTRCRRVPAWH